MMVDSSLIDILLAFRFYFIGLLGIVCFCCSREAEGGRITAVVDQPGVAMVPSCVVTSIQSL